MSNKEENVNKEKAVPVSFKFPPDVKVLLDKLAKHQLRSQTQTLIFLIQDAAKKSGIK